MVPPQGLVNDAHKFCTQVLLYVHGEIYKLAFWIFFFRKFLLLHVLNIMIE